MRDINQFEDKVFEELVKKENEINLAEVFPFEYKGKKYWVKKARATKSNIFHKIFYKLSSIDILVPVEDKTPIKAMLFEVNKINIFNEKEIATSKIIGVSNNFFVMSDTGIHLYGLLKNNNIKKDEFYYYLDKIIFTLSNIHNNNLYHGGAQSRNFTYKNSMVSVIDFEDSFANDIDIKVLQLRDFMLLLLSMTKVDNIKFDYMYIIEKYIEETKNDKFLVELKKLARKMNFLVKLNKINFFHKIFPRDVKGFCKLLEELNKL